MLSYNESLKILKETEALLDGHFILSSGLHSNKYIQCAKLLSHPEKAEIICSSLCEKIKKEFEKPHIILSPALGGVVVGYEIGRQLKTETIFAERVDGKLTLRRGFKLEKNSKVLIVEDVITTGKSILECLNLVKEFNANLIGYACIIDRSNKNIFNDKKIVSQIKFNIDTFTKDKIPDELKQIEAVKPGSRSLSK